MAGALLFPSSLYQAFSNAGTPLSGAKVKLFLAGTNTPTDAFSSPSLDVSLGAVIIADSAGRFPAIWLPQDRVHKVVLTDAADVVIQTLDPINTVTDDATTVVEQVFSGDASNRIFVMTGVSVTAPANIIAFVGGVYQRVDLYEVSSDGLNTTVTFDSAPGSGSNNVVLRAIIVEGLRGEAGPPAALTWAFDTSTTDADPGAGKFRLNSATLAAATVAFIDVQTEFGNVDVTSFLNSWDDSDSLSSKGFLVARSQEAAGNLAVWRVLSVTTASGYRKIGIQPLATAGAWTANEVFALSFSATGDRGDPGVGGSTQIKTSAFNAVAGRILYLVDTSAGPVTATLPASPSDEDTVSFADGAVLGSWGTNTLTLARNGQSINGAAADLACTISRGFFTLVFRTGVGWVITEGASTAASFRSLLLAAGSATTITGTGGLEGGGDLTANRTLNIANGGVTSARLASGAALANITDGTITAAKLAAGVAASNLGFTPLNRANNLSDIANAATARTNLGAQAALGYTAFNAANFTGSNILTQLLTVDGAGSGLDADLLDGFQASAFSRLDASPTFTSSSFSPVGNWNAALRTSGNFGGGLVIQEGTGAGGIWTSSSGANLHFSAGGTSAGFGSPTGQMTLSGSGLSVTGTVTAASDRRVKRDIEDLTISDAWAILDGLRPRSFVKRDQAMVGFIAQEIGDGRFRFGDEWSLYSVPAGSEWAAPLVAAIKDLRARLDALAARS